MKRQQYIVFGAGKFGESVAITLEEHGYEVMVVDKDPEKIQEIAPQVGYAVCADMEEPEVFADFGLESMDGAVVALTENLSASIISVMKCHEAGIPHILAKAKDQTHEKILRVLGAHKIVYPEVEMGKRIAKYITADNFIDWIELSPLYSMVDMEIPRNWGGRTLAELQLRKKYGINVIGFKQGDLINIRFSPSDPIPAEGTVIMVGENEEIEKAVRDQEKIR